MSSSQNGWPVNPVRRKWLIPGVNRHLYLRDGSAGFILIHFALWFHEKIERLDQGIWDEWGWADRPIRDSNVTSNHASGTAMDLNATKHPLGVVNTFSWRLRGWIRLRLRFYSGTLRWGGDYQFRKDDMHFEIDRHLPKCEKVAKRLMKTPRGKRILAANPGAKRVILS